MEVAPNLIETARAEVLRAGDLQRAAECVLEGEREAESARLHRRGVRDAAIHLKTGEPEVLEPELVPAEAKGPRVKLDDAAIEIAVDRRLDATRTSSGSPRRPTAARK